MNRVPRARYTREFREEAVKLAEAVRASEASRRLSIPLKSLANWQRAAKAGKLEEVGRQQKPQTELEAELQRTKRELAEVKMERDLAPGASGSQLVGVNAVAFITGNPHRDSGMRIGCVAVD